MLHMLNTGDIFIEQVYNGYTRFDGSCITLQAPSNIYPAYSDVKNTSSCHIGKQFLCNYCNIQYLLSDVLGFVMVFELRSSQVPLIAGSID